MKKLIAIALIIASMVGFCRGHHGFRPIHRPPIHHFHTTPHHHIHHHHHSIGPVIAGTIIGSTLGSIIANTVVNRVWIPEQRIITGYDVYNRPIYTIIPGHWEYK